MGTEFSLLLNRLLNVLDVPRERLHFIITSASLGADEATKQKYVKDLLSLSDERSAELVMPQSTIVIECRPRRSTSNGRVTMSKFKPKRNGTKR